MDIRTNLNSVNSMPAVDQASSKKSPARAASTANPSAEDQVTISNLSHSILATGGASKAREAKVAELKAAVANGTYKPSAKDIASAMIESPLNTQF